MKSFAAAMGVGAVLIWDPAWGALKSRTKPVPGNHEYNTTGASGYFGYFGSIAGSPSTGYYSYNIGDWHIIALNSNCSPVGGCGSGSKQEKWLRADLAANSWWEPGAMRSSGSARPRQTLKSATPPRSAR